MAANEVPMNVDVPEEVKDAVEKTALRLKLAGDRKASKKSVVADCLKRFLPTYEKERMKEIKAKP